MKWLLRSGLVFFVVWTTQSHAASFDCQKAQSQTEKAICQNRVLNDADVKMATSYNIIRHLVPMGTRSVIQRDQVKWLQFRDQCQESVDCLTQVYKMRQQQIDLQFDRVYRQGPF
ncbi:lysozyme inhibitor LprI family protein [Acinetobacter schindleri]|uniref:lysozyme inhibitor LprI family protein n=1 Tax=Acinetobacter schindleri TaxID=108981 RepID=UPI00281239AC|nr:lysozyme inhibitor LprI family protein [Acinetobacter schindleri]